MNVTYRVFGDETGQFTFREVFTEHDRRIITFSQAPVLPMGESVEELASELEWLKEALAQPVLTAAEMDKEIARQSRPSKPARKTISHAKLMTKLGLDQEDRQDAVELSAPSHVN